jgi:hypothetical protein
MLLSGIGMARVVRGIRALLCHVKFLLLWCLPQLTPRRVQDWKSRS